MTKLLENRAFALNMALAVFSQLAVSFWLAGLSVAGAFLGIALTYLFLTGTFAMARTAVRGSSKFVRIYKDIVLPLGVIWQLFVFLLLLLILINLWLGMPKGNLVLVGVILTFLFCLLGGMRSLFPKRVDVIVGLENLPVEFDGLKIAVLADMHAGAKLLKSSYKRINGLVRAANPDLVVLLGDVVDYDWTYGSKTVQSLLKGLTPPLGIFGVLGNHDVYGNIGQLLGSLQGNKLQMLLNESTILSRGDSQIFLVGITDPVAEAVDLGPDPTKAFSTIPKDTFVVVLSHRPEAFLWLETYKPDIVISGHTHGGHYSTITGFHKYSRGLYRKGERVLYVSTGIGDIGITRRFRCPEVNILTLKRKGGRVESKKAQ